MKVLGRTVITASLLGLVMVAAPPALADGDVRCDGGPQSGWQPIAKVKKKVWLEGWKIIKAQVDGDCYEVYAHNAEGQSVEAFFHPVTLKKLLVKRRGTEVYRAPGFTG